MSKIIFLFTFFGALVSLGSVFALDANAQTETRTFFVESSYDISGRKEIEAQLVRADNRIYFYIEKNWWGGRSPREQNDLRIALFELGQEFQNHIYPVLTSTFGSEPNPGVDKDAKLTILIHQMAGEAGGYFRSNDVYEKAVSPTSNAREMVYLNSEYIGEIEAKSFLAHEFTHLITINQKDLLRRVAEETWLNEARAEYASTLLGYDDVYEGSNLQRRVRNFLENPTNSLTEWLNTKEDYGVINMFVQYLVDHYGKDVLIDSLKSSQVGIASLDEALQRNGFKEDFAQIFQDWAITVLVNNCEVGSKYCYANPNLASLRVAPVSYYIPGGETVVSTNHTAPAWSANWHRFVGGGQNFTLEFEGTSVVDFEVPYLLCDLHYECSVGFFSLDEEQKGIITFSQFDKTYSSLTIIPFLKGKTSGFSGRENTFLFSWEVKVQREAEAKAQEEVQLRNQLLARVAELQAQIRQLRSRIAALQGQRNPPQAVSCTSFNRNLSFGVQGEEVRCLQEFLASQGPEVYPEGLVTGNFLSLTKQAVIRFQEIYAPEILAPLSLNSGTGYVGQTTRNKMNQMIGSLVAI
ncbi:MAG: hypothetical protein HYT49_00480 [Candidatus Wildermuthbacteria bacterium]|nr:hypothetical protein [Candidatus Wildermuthbacteria bacterium]